MRIGKTSDRQFVVIRGPENWPQYFSFYVDDDKSSWTKYIEQAHKHTTLTSAETTLVMLRQRERIRRKRSDND